MFISFFLIFSILAGQLIKFPLFGNLGPTLLDFFVIIATLLGLLNLRFRLKKPPLFIILGFVFVCVALLSLILTPLHLNNFEYLVSFSYTIRFVLFLIFCWILTSGAFHHLKKNIPSLLMNCGLGLSILGLLQLIFYPNLQLLKDFGWDPHYFRTVSTFLDPNFAGAFFVLTLLLYSINEKKSKNLWINFYIPFTITFLALLTTFSRSSYLMFLVSGTTLAYFEKSKIILLKTIILFVVLMGGFYTYTQIVALPRNIDRLESASSRINTWIQGIEIFKRSTFLGIGYNSYKYAIEEYNLSDPFFLQSRGSSSNDSSLLSVSATTGIVGFATYGLFLFTLLRIGKRQNTILISGLSGLIIHSFFSNSLFYPFILIWIILMATYKPRTS